MNSSNSNFYPRLLVAEERETPPNNTSTLQYQPFLRASVMHPLDRFSVNLTREGGTWSNALSKEQTVYALAQVSAACLLPALVELDTGNALLEYRVSLRQYLDSLLISELVNVLETCGKQLHWGQIEANVYAAVIGAGVAVCIDTTPDCETLYFRYASALEMELHSARHAADLPRSRLGLQEVVHERFDALLDQIRARTWHWLIG